MEVLLPSRGNRAKHKSRAVHTTEFPSAMRGSVAGVGLRLSNENPRIFTPAPIRRPDGSPPGLFTRIRVSVSNISAVRAPRDHVSPLVVRRNTALRNSENFALSGNWLKFLGDIEVSMDNALASGSERTVCDTPDRVVFRAADPAPDAGRKESKKSELGKTFHQPFINSRLCSPPIRLKRGHSSDRSQ
jgi:hypothetical protein